jgi:diguanylate cyclase (GGDEF)-like protein/PAS domain S-box-containing protein
VRPLQSTLPAIFVLLLGLGTTFLLWQHEREEAAHRLHTRFDNSLRDITARVVQRISAYEQMLRGVQGYHLGSAPISRHGFSAYVQSLQLGADFAGIQGVGLIRLSTPADKDKLVSQLRKQGLADFDIKPSGARQIYAPIIQVEPFSGRNLVALGFDPYSDPVRRAAMDAARHAGAPRITSKLKQVLDRSPNEGPSFIMYAPLFQGIRSDDLLTPQRSQIVGWAYAPVRLNDLMASLYGEPDPDIAVRIYDGIDNNENELLYDSHQRDIKTAQLVSQEYLEVLGRSWTIEARALPAFTARSGRPLDQIIAVSGICVSLLLAVLTHILVSGRALAVKLANSMTAKLRDSEERWKYALEGAGDGLWDRNLQTNEIYYSKRCLEIFGYSDTEILPLRSEWIERIHPDDRDQALAATQACVDGTNNNFSSEYRLRCKDGRWKWVLSRGHVMSRDAKGTALRLIGTVSDIDERKAIEEKIRHMAQHDSLTDLPNRALFADRLHQALSLARRDNSLLALLFVDLDEFKHVNDSFGHGVGDQLLQEAAHRMRECIRESDTVGRVGGDEFVVLLPHLNIVDDAAYVAEKIRAAIAETFLIGGHTIRISASIGIANAPTNCETDEALWTAADEAMYASKAAGGNRITISKPPSQEPGTPL